MPSLRNGERMTLAGEVCQGVTVLAAKPDSLSLIPMMEGRTECYNAL